MHGHIRNLKQLFEPMDVYDFAEMWVLMAKLLLFAYGIAL